MITFFYSTGTCSTAAHIALEEAGIPFNGVEVSWQRKLNIEELAAVNKLGQVPVLVIDGKSLNQGTAIMEYIADQAITKNLLPAPGTWERLQANSWLAFAAGDLQKSFPPIFHAAKWTNDTNVQNDIKKATRESIDKQLAHLDYSLTGKEYILGKQYSLVDTYIFVITGWCKWAEVNVSKYPNLTAYLKRVNARPAVQKILAAEGLKDYLPS